MAKQVKSWLGVDFAPEQIENIINHYMAGPFRLVTAFLESGNDGLRRTSAEETANQVMPSFFRAMGGSLAYGKSHDTGQAMYYQAVNHYNELLRSRDINIHSREYGSNVPKREMYQTTQMQKGGFTPEQIADVLRLQRMKSQLSSLEQKATTNLRPLFQSSEDSTPLKEAFHGLAQQRERIYNGNDGIMALNYFASAR
jgi:hypothetical protein